MYALLDAAQCIAGYECILDPQAEGVAVWNWFLKNKKIAAAAFEVAYGLERSEPGVEVQGVSIASGSISRLDVSADRWMDAMWLALSCRDERTVGMLCAIPTELLRESNSMSLSEYFFVWVDAVKSYLRRDGDFLGILMAAMEATDPDVVGETAEHALKIAFPSMKLLYCLALGEEAEFRETFAMAVDLHRSFWSGDAESSSSAVGFMARGPLAHASLAYDAGMREVSVPSYVPSGLVTGRWVSVG
ncbi:immunity 49 family protein [Streptomyces sp. NPDC004779]